jgi:hypothetical protein
VIGKVGHAQSKEINKDPERLSVSSTSSIERRREKKTLTGARRTSKPILEVMRGKKEIIVKLQAAQSQTLEVQGASS